MTTDIHPIIALFQARAELLDLQGSKATLDDAMAQLAGWLGWAAVALSEEDMAVLSEVGAILYREGLHRRGG